MAIFRLTAFTTAITRSASAVQVGSTFSVDSPLISVNATVQATLAADERYYIGFIQVCTANKNYFEYQPPANPAALAAGPLVLDTTAQVRHGFNLSTLPCSDASDTFTRPWYGSGGAEVRRKQLLGKHASGTHSLSMTDNLATSGIPVIDGVFPAPVLVRIKRKQAFTTWFVAVKIDGAGALANYIPLASFDWSYDMETLLSHTIATIPGGAALRSVASISRSPMTTSNLKTLLNTDFRTDAVKKPASTVAPLIQAALTAPTANKSQVEF